MHPVRALARKYGHTLDDIGSAVGLSRANVDVVLDVGVPDRLAPRFLAWANGNLTEDEVRWRPPLRRPSRRTKAERESGAPPPQTYRPTEAESKLPTPRVRQALAKRGIGNADIARAHSVTPRAVYQWFTKFGIPVHLHGWFLDLLRGDIEPHDVRPQWFAPGESYRPPRRARSPEELDAA
jgi:hypothetical protein